MDWVSDAACGEYGAEAFFGDDQSQHLARSVCDRCPVISACLHQAFEDLEADGVWGGLAAWQRQVIFRSAAEADASIALPVDTDSIQFFDRFGKSCGPARSAWANVKDGRNPDAESWCDLRQEAAPPKSNTRGQHPGDAPLSAATLRELWVAELERSFELSFEEMWARLQSLGYSLKGDGRKGQLKNVYHAAATDSRLRKVRPGVFTLRMPVPEPRRKPAVKL